MKNTEEKYIDMKKEHPPYGGRYVFKMRFGEDIVDLEANYSSIGIFREKSHGKYLWKELEEVISWKRIL